MTVTGERADGSESVDDAELATLEAAAEQARGDARRAAQAVRLARLARKSGAAAAPATPATGSAPATADPAAPADSADDEVADGKPSSSRTSLTKRPTPAAAAPVTDDAVDDDTDDEPVAEDSADASASDSDDSDDTTATPRRRPRTVTLAAAVAAVLAAAFAVIALVVHQQAADARSTSPAAARDAVLLAARQDIVVLNTLDYTDVDGGLQRWLGATTGTLRDQLSQVSDSDKQAIAVSKSRTTASVLAAAVTQLDATKGNATVIASVQIDVTPDGGQATQKRTRFSLTMQRVGDVWKIGAVQQVGVTLT